MNNPLQQFGQVIRKWWARAVESPKRYAAASWAATWSLAEVLAELMESKFLPDVSRIKEAALDSIEAETDKKKAEADKANAEAQLRLAEAAQASNNATLHKRRDAMALAERHQIAVETAKTAAEAEAIRMDAETRRIEAIAASRARLLEAIAKLRQEGGEMFIDPEDVDRIIRFDPLLLEDSSQADDSSSD